MEAVNVILDVLNKAGTLGGLIVVGLAVWKKELVLGWQYREKEAELETCRMVANAYATKTEAKLERLEAERDKRNAPTA